MNYIGSKHSLLPFLEQVFRQVVPGGEQVFCDLFAGTGAVGRHFKRLGMRVLANDLQYYAYVLNRAYLELDAPPGFEGLRRAFPSASERAGETAPETALRLLNSLPPVPGFLREHYSPEGSRHYFTRENAGRADAIRGAAESWYRAGTLTEPEYFYVLCSLLEAVDQVANTASVYGAYLKRFKASALRPLRLHPLQLSNHGSGCRVFQKDANELIREIECDVLYLDPPYNQRQYGANYHVLETVARYDSPCVRGTSGMRDYPRSRYCRAGQVENAFEHLVRSARTSHILVSYNDEGLMPLDRIRQILALRGEPRTYARDYNRYKADNGRAYRRVGTVEYVHYVRVEREA